MKTLYLECNMGAAGDMLMAALLELHPDPQGFVQRLNDLSIRGVSVEALPAVKCGITGTHMMVKIHGVEEESLDVDHQHHHQHEHADDHQHQHQHDSHQHHHSGMEEIRQIIAGLDLSHKVKDDVLAVYNLIAQAESHAHGQSVEQVHFHEVGTMDAVADIVGVCLLLEELAPDCILASPIHVGSGQISCAHGILPVPAPATADILKDVPIYGGSIQGELCTPTGAALLKYLVEDFCSMPIMKVNKIGYGMGKKDFSAANCLRAFWGATDAKVNKEDDKQIIELSCNLDDMTGEALGFAQEQLWAGGALDIFTTAIGMKKNRPAVLLTCLCHEAKREEMIKLLFRHTTTLGIREHICQRYTLSRLESSMQTSYGTVHFKEASGWGVSRKKTEYEDLAKIAGEQNISLAEAALLIENINK